MAEQNYYKLLGVDATASSEDIKRAYRHKAIKYHPDKNPNDREALEKFRQITEAYNTLIDHKRRAKYDRKLISRAESFRASSFRERQRYYGRFSEVKKILSNIFTKGHVIGDRRSGRPAKGVDVRQEVTITLSEAALGCTKIFKINFDDICDRYGYSIVVNRTKEIRLRIFPGIRDGTCLKISEQGGTGAKGGPRGDLYVTVLIQPDKFLTLKGNDIHCEVKLDFVRALLGTKLKVSTVDGKVELTVPPCTQPDQILCISGKGFPKAGGQGRGDQFVTIKVVFPNTVSSRQRELIKQFYEI